ncbi:MAG TPA: hypothetical protein VK634_17160 [Reyranella sp.]|nr:hypothetical protein [Reyranella sp.]HTE82417.1 hypothetical protein [Reyranella sp.]
MNEALIIVLLGHIERRAVELDEARATVARLHYRVATLVDASQAALCDNVDLTKQRTQLQLEQERLLAVVNAARHFFAVCAKAPSDEMAAETMAASHALRSAVACITL